MRVSFANILATLLSCILIVVFIALCYFYDEKTGTINLTNQEFYTQEEMDSNYDKGYQTATTNQSSEMATLLAQIDTLTSAKNSVESELSEKNELLEEYQLTNSRDKQTIVNLENEITRLNSQIAILEADIEYYIEQLNNQETALATAVFYLDEQTTDAYYTKVLKSGETLSSSDVPLPDNTVYKKFLGWATSSTATILTTIELTKDTIYYAQWQTIAYDITFVNGVTNEIIETKIVNIEDVLTTPTPPVIEGYKFIEYSPTIPSNYHVTQDMTITAIYRAIPVEDYVITTTISGAQQSDVYDTDNLILNNFDDISSLTLNGDLIVSTSYKFTDDTGKEFASNSQFTANLSNVELTCSVETSSYKYFVTQTPVTFTKNNDTITKTMYIQILFCLPENNEAILEIHLSDDNNVYAYADFYGSQELIMTINIS